MSAQIRVIRQRVRSAQSIKKITRAQELIAASRIVKAQQRVHAAKPYAEEITKVVTALASKSATGHPLLVPRERVRAAGILVVTSDRSQCGGYNANVLRAAENLAAELRERGVESSRYVVGRKGDKYFRFRERPVAESWTGFSELPTFDHARMIGEALTTAFTPAEGAEAGEVDELYVVSTEFVSMLSQVPVVRRVAPLALDTAASESTEAGEATGPQAAYEFEPDTETLLSALLPKYVNTRIFAALLDAAASEQAARRAAMKAATDNADDLIRELSRAANAARQAQITQEISEIVGGANALTAAGSDD